MRLILLILYSSLAFADLVLTDKIFTPPIWDNSTRPTCNQTTCQGYNTTTQSNEYWNSVLGTWEKVGTGTGGSIDQFQSGYDYKTNDLIMLNRDLYMATTNFTSGADFETEFAAGNFTNFSPTDSAGGLGKVPTIGITPPNTINIGSGVGLFADPFTKPGIRTFKRVNFNAQDIVIPSTPLSRYFIRINDLGVAEVVSGKPSSINYQDDIIVAYVSTDDIGEIFSAYQHGWVSGLTDSKIQDSYYYGGMKNAEGNQFSSIAGTLNINKTSGKLYGIGLNPSNFREPNVIEVTAQNPLTFFYATSTSLSLLSSTNLINPNLYQPNGTGSTVSVGSNKWTTQRIFLTAYGKTVIQYGQKEYNTSSEALADLDISPFIANQIVSDPDDSIWTGFLILLRGATNLADPAQAILANCGRSGCEGSGASNAGPVNGDVFGPPSTIANSIPIFDGTTGKIIKSSSSTIDNFGLMTINAGTGNSYSLPSTRGTAGQILQSDGTGTTSWTSASAIAGSGTQLQKSFMSIPTDNWTTVVWSSGDIINNTLGAFDDSTDSFVISSSGYYTISASGWFSNEAAAGQRGIRFWITNNGSITNNDFGYVATNSADTGFINGIRLPITTSIMMYLVSGAKVANQVYQNSGSPLDYGTQTGNKIYFSIVKH